MLPGFVAFIYFVAKPVPKHPVSLALSLRAINLSIGIAVLVAAMSLALAMGQWTSSARDQTIGQLRDDTEALSITNRRLRNYFAVLKWVSAGTSIDQPRSAAVTQEVLEIHRWALDGLAQTDLQYGSDLMERGFRLASALAQEPDSESRRQEYVHTVIDLIEGILGEITPLQKDLWDRLDAQKKQLHHWRFWYQ